MLAWTIYLSFAGALVEALLPKGRAGLARGVALVVALAGLSGEQTRLKEDAVHLLLDEARVLEGDRPADPRSFSERLARVLEKSVGEGV